MNTSTSIWGETITAPKTTGTVFGTPLAEVLPPVLVSNNPEQLTIIRPKVQKGRKASK